jgi:hypothetical protein
MADEKLKSAYELALERLARQDATEGRESPQKLGARQKREIAAKRQEAEAKLAEIEILHAKEVDAVAGDPEKLAELEERRRIDRRRVESALESAIERIKKKR